MSFSISATIVVDGETASVSVTEDSVTFTTPEGTASYDKRVTEVPASPAAETSPEPPADPDTGSFAQNAPVEDEAPASEDPNAPPAAETEVPAPSASTSESSSTVDAAPAVDVTSADYLAGEAAQKAVDDATETAEDAVRAANVAAATETTPAA